MSASELPVRFRVEPGDYSPSPPTDPYVRDYPIRFVGSRDSYLPLAHTTKLPVRIGSPEPSPAPLSDKGQVTRVVTSERRSWFSPQNVVAGFAFPPAGPLGIGSPPSRPSNGRAIGTMLS